MSLLEFSKRELDRIGLTEHSPEEMNQAMRQHVIHMMEEFCNEGHSGFSASYAVNILSKLMKYEPLSPLTGEDDEWNEVSDGNGGKMYQNNRCSHVFKLEGKQAYDMNGIVFWEWQRRDDGTAYKSYYRNSGCSTPVTFPYTPKEPEYVYRYSDAEPPAPPQTKEGLL